MEDRVHSLRRVVAGALAVVGLVAARPVRAVPFQRGDVFAGVAGGTVLHYDKSLNLLEQLSTGVTADDAETAGCAFDAAGNLYVTNFDGVSVSRFDSTGKALGFFGSGYTGGPESILFDRAGNAYVGAATRFGGDADVRKFDPSGTLLTRFDVAIEDRGSDWIDLAGDGCTLFYTSEGKCVKRYNVCTSTQLTDFSCELPGRFAYGLRLLSDGSVLVANTDAIRRLGITGTVVKEYDAPGFENWFALNLDPDGTSFWSGDLSDARFAKFDIESAAQLAGPVDTMRTSMNGICVFGEITAATSCVQRTDGTPCDDGDECTGGDSCRAGQCEDGVQCSATQIKGADRQKGKKPIAIALTLADTSAGSKATVEATALLAPTSTGLTTRAAADTPVTRTVRRTLGKKGKAKAKLKLKLNAFGKQQLAAAQNGELRVTVLVRITDRRARVTTLRRLLTLLAR